MVLTGIESYKHSITHRKQTRVTRFLLPTDSGTVPSESVTGWMLSPSLTQTPKTVPSAC